MRITDIGLPPLLKSYLRPCLREFKILINRKLSIWFIFS